MLPPFKTRPTWPAALVLGALLLPAAALANSGAPPFETGTGGGPETTVTAPFTNSLGVTKPPGVPLSGTPGDGTGEHHRERALSDRIQRSICQGCI
jgi:hypothetical protein